MPLCLNNTKKDNPQLFLTGDKKIFVLFNKRYINIMVEINGYTVYEKTE
jgi:hypothetical protein